MLIAYQKKLLVSIFVALTVGLLLSGEWACSQRLKHGARAKPPIGPTSRQEIFSGTTGYCGYSPALAYRMNQQAHNQSEVSAGQSPSAAGPPPPISVAFTSQNNFPQGPGIVTCGKFRLYYEDFLHTPGGFSDPIDGPARRATLCAVLNYVESTFDIKVNGTNNFIDLYINESWTLNNNPPPPLTTYLAVAAPYYNPASGYGTTAGYYPGNVLLHATDPLGTDPEPGQYDGTILVNFAQYYSQGTYYPIDYSPTSACHFDLFSVLLHEVTHALGFVSNVQEDTNFDAVCGVPTNCNATNNAFTKFDQLFLYYSSNPCPSGVLTKVVTGTSPSINPAVSSQTNELRSNRIWLRNGPIEQNHPIYSGTLDPYYTLIVGSIASHMAGSLLSFTAMSQYAPGFQPNYVMSPYIKVGQRKSEWTLAELRILLSLGYVLNPAFSVSTSLNGTDQNGWLLQNNSPAYRTNCSQPMLAYNTPFNFMETLPADALLPNNNTTINPTASQLPINVASLGVADAQGDAIRVMPGTLFGIRGVSGNANNHAALSMNTSGSQIVYTPEPGFHGRAQFGFYLWDGHERGALRIVTIDVTPGSYVVTPGNQLVINPGLEDGTEMRQWLLNPNIEHSSWVDETYEGVFAGQNLSGGHPFNFITNWFNLASGDIMEDDFYICYLGPNAQNGTFGSINNYWAPNMSFGFNYPVPVNTSAPNERYHVLAGDKNYSTLINQVQGCNVYQFEADLNFERSGVTVGQIFTLELQFVDNPSPNFHTQLYYTVPVNVPVSTIAHNSWQHVTFTFQYCGTPTYFMNLLVQGVLSNPPIVVSGTGGSSLSNTFTPSNSVALIDNISLKQVSPTPALTLNTTANPNNCTKPVTLTSLPVSYVPCNASYTWQPGNLAGNSVIVSPNTTTTYTLTCSSSSCPQLATSTITVNAGNNISTTWPKHPTGSPLREAFNAVGTMPNGDIVAAGFFSSNETFPGFPTFTTQLDKRQLIVYRFSENCGTIWAVTLGNPTQDETVNDLVVDAAGNIFLTGSIGPTTTFGLQGPAAFVLKLNGNTGAIMAATASTPASAGAQAGAQGYALALDGSGNVYLAGVFGNPITFGTLLPRNSVGSTDVFVVRFNNVLNPVWITSFGSAAADSPGGIGLSSSGALYVAANIGGSMTIGFPAQTFPNAGAGTNDVFIGRFNSSTGLYVNNSGRMEGNATSNCEVRDLVVDAAGTVYFTGSFKGPFTTLNSATQDAYIASWTSTLSNNWIRQIGGSGPDTGRALNFDGAGNLYATGEYVGTAGFPGFTPSSLTGVNSTAVNVYVVKMSLGNVPAYAAGSNSFFGSATYALGLAALPSGTAFVGGYFGSLTTFGTTSIMASAQTDSYLARISPTGTFY